MFRALPDRWDQNRGDYQALNVHPAVHMHPYGDEFPGVVLKHADRLRYVLTTGEAVALCNALLQAIDQANAEHQAKHAAGTAHH